MSSSAEDPPWVVKEEPEDVVVKRELEELEMETEEEYEDLYPPPGEVKEENGEEVKKRRRWRKRQSADMRRKLQRERARVKRASKPPPPPKEKKKRKPSKMSEAAKEKARFAEKLRRLNATPEERRERYLKMREKVGEDKIRESQRKWFQNLTPEKRQRWNEKMKENYRKRMEKIRQDPVLLEEHRAKERERAKKKQDKKNPQRRKRAQLSGEEKKRLREEIDQLRFKRNRLKQRLQLRQKLLETGLTMEQVVSQPEMTEKREKILQTERTRAAQKSLRKRLEKAGVDPEEIERQVEELGRTYTGVRRGREYKPRKNTKYYDSSEMEKLQKELDEVDERLRRLRGQEVMDEEEEQTSTTKHEATVSLPLPSFSSPQQFSKESQSSVAKPRNSLPIKTLPPPLPWSTWLRGQETDEGGQASTKHKASVSLPLPSTSTQHFPKESQSFFAKMSAPPHIQNLPPPLPWSTNAEPPTSSLDSFHPDSGDGQDSCQGDSDNSAGNSDFGDYEDNHVTHTSFEPQRAPLWFPYSTALPPHPQPAPSPSTSSVFSRKGRPPKAVSNPHICPDCGRCFAARDNLRHHINFYHHPGYDVVNKMCLLCSASFPKPNQWYTHYRTDHSTHHENHQRLLQQRFPNSYQQKKKEGSAICDECGSRFSGPDTLRAHKKHYHHPSYDPQKKVCRECGQWFRRPHMWYNHYRLTHVLPKKKGIVCDECGQVYPSDRMSQHQRQSHGEPHICPVCGSKIQSKYHYLQHLRKYHPEHDATTGVHQCLRCPQSFMDVSALVEHVQEHHPQSYFPCKFCGKCKFTRLALHAHYIRSDICTKLSAEELQQMKKEMPKGEIFELDILHLPCELCGRKIRLVKLTQHYKRVHNVMEDEWNCETCGKQYKSRKYWAAHLEEVHEKNVEELRQFAGKLNASNREGMRLKSKWSKGASKPEKKRRGRGKVVEQDSSEEEKSDSEESLDLSEDEKEAEEEDKEPKRKKERRKVVVICEEDEQPAEVKVEKGPKDGEMEVFLYDNS